MMKLSTMKKVVATVDKKWRSPLAEFILERWGFDRHSVFYWRASANFIFMFQHHGKKYYLRFNDSCERNLTMIKEELKLVQYLGSQALAVAQPVLSKNNNLVEVVITPIGTFYAVVFEALDGEHLSFEEMNEEQLFVWGEMLGTIHENLKNVPNDLAIKRPSWKDDLEKVKEWLPPNEIAAMKELEMISEWANQLPITKENFGIIHYDFELDNVRFNEITISALDFDDCAYYWYVADIVYALRDAGKFRVTTPAIKTFMKGYKSSTFLDEELLEEANGFERLHHLVSFARLLRSVDKDYSKEEPGYQMDLSKNLVSLINNYRLSFEQNHK
ncbi:phosphotransferase enzyme family protein [Halalkalibacterium halodurans]|nr:phosphotransferase enzyme family protein [Halalkalibacterium halodurans]MED3647869.1 phosphotransferase enzyme family protein [Halalkalibacterium halodurans]MED4162798.1 phosphotransferase enzyme family protein [Halalkalibacterium halodurans]